MAVELFATGVRFAPKPLIAPFGDSISDYNFKHATGTIGESFGGQGYVSQACALLKGRVQMRTDLNYGVPGDSTADMLARIDDVTASDADIISFLGGTNDITDQVAYSTIVGNLATMYEALIAAGKVVIVSPIWPRSYWASLTAPQILAARKKLLRVNSWIREYARTQRNGQFYVADCDVYTMDWGSATGDPIASSTTDGLHPLGIMAHRAANALVAVLETILPPSLERIYSQADVYDATDNPTGALNSNPCMAGSGGVLGTGASGTISAGYKVERSTGTVLTAACTVPTLSGDNGGSALQIELGATGAGSATETIRVLVNGNITAGAGTYQSGDVLYGEIEVEQSGLSLVQQIYVQAVDFDGVASKNYYGLYTSGNATDREPAAAARLIRTPEFTVAPYAGSGTQIANVYLLINAKCDGSAPAGTITIKSMALRKA